MTYLEAEAWASSHGLAIDLSVHRDPKTSAAPFDIEAAYCALIENLRAQVEGEPQAPSDLVRRVDDLRAVLSRLVDNRDDADARRAALAVLGRKP